MDTSTYDSLYSISSYYEVQEDCPENVLKSFAFLLSDNRSLLERAVCLVDDIEIVKIQSSTTDRHFWLLKSSNSTKKYRVMNQFCPCRYHFDQFRRAGKQGAVCKHILAVLLASAMHRTKIRVVGNDEFVGLLAEKQGYF
jgi:predicted nucleic acid-binding Zn finger protein